jgi:hypothetical protein
MTRNDDELAIWSALSLCARERLYRKYRQNNRHE